MKKVLFFIILVLLLSCQEKTPSWQMASTPLKTRWADQVSHDNAWPEYPRPQLVRSEWLNLNGLWDFAITPKGEPPEAFSQKILVPFPVESALSGIGQRVSHGEQVWYQRQFRLSPYWKGKRILLHLEASDWETRLWVNDSLAGEHRGGYDPFTVDISAFTRVGQKNTLRISVWDPTDTGYQPRGKQVSEPKGIFYTPTTGIWQTVWLEPVAPSFIEDIRIVPDLDSSLFRIMVHVSQAIGDGFIRAGIGDSVFAKGQPGEWFTLPVREPRYWKPDDPFLYDIRLWLNYGNRAVDEVMTYAGFRKISLERDVMGHTRMFLNNEPVFQSGPLDQGFWPDGIYTPPCDAAMRYDIEITKAMGFNMLRKHVKVENRRFYYWCDKLGILVWQDMPSTSGYVAPGEPDLERPEEERTQFELELTRMIMHLANHPSIIMWIPFNEGWGQYETGLVVELIQSIDPTRLVNNASGWQDRGVGDIFDIHHYPEPQMPALEQNRASVLGEFGGLGHYVEGHTWQKENWGYQKITDPQQLSERFTEFYDSVRVFHDRGMSAAVYTQITDVETECNGLMTYDREVIKIDTVILKHIHHGLTK